MIINVRGTHGAGKTYLVRTVLGEFRTRRPVFVDDRRHPIGYVCRDRRAARKLFVLGHYEGDASGGCDTIPKVKTMYRMIRRYANRGYDVLFEGILAQHSTPRIRELFDDGYRVRLVMIDIAERRAIKSVRRRRKARGNFKPLDPKNIRKEVQSVRRATDVLEEYGIPVRRVSSRRDGLNVTLRLLGLT